MSAQRSGMRARGASGAWAQRTRCSSARGGAALGAWASCAQTPLQTRRDAPLTPSRVRKATHDASPTARWPAGAAGGLSAARKGRGTVRAPTTSERRPQAAPARPGARSAAPRAPSRDYSANAPRLTPIVAALVGESGAAGAPPVRVTVVELWPSAEGCAASSSAVSSAAARRSAMRAATPLGAGRRIGTASRRAHEVGTACRDDVSSRQCCPRALWQRCAAARAALRQAAAGCAGCAPRRTPHLRRRRAPASPPALLRVSPPRTQQVPQQAPL